MFERQVDLWSSPGVIVITTNGFVKRNGEAVMGRGCAAEAKQRYPSLPVLLGRLLSAYGNRCFLMTLPDIGELITFPVKHNWYEVADSVLIERSAKQLVAIADNWGFEEIWLPRPGCGNGKLSWEHVVKPLLEPILDDRFIIVHR